MTPNAPRSPNFQAHLTVKEAAAFPAVSPNTLRNWDRAGRLAAIRHPINGHRLYERHALAGMLARIGVGPGAAAVVADPVPAPCPGQG